MPASAPSGPSSTASARTQPAQTQPAQTQPAQTQPAPRLAAPTQAPRAWPSRSRADAATDLQHALLGGDATAEELPAALRDTVQALEEIFPGDVVAVSRRKDVPDPDHEGDGTLAAPPGAAPDPDDESVEPGSDESQDRTTPHRTDAG